MQIPPPEIVHFGSMQGMVQVQEVSCDPCGQNGEIWETRCALEGMFQVFKPQGLTIN